MKNKDSIKVKEKDLIYIEPNYTMGGIKKDWLITAPPMNIIIQMGEVCNGVRFQFYVKKTYLNRLKYYLFCKFFPFKIIEWTEMKI